MCGGADDARAVHLLSGRVCGFLHKLVVDLLPLCHGNPGVLGAPKAASNRSCLLLAGALVAKADAASLLAPSPLTC